MEKIKVITKSLLKPDPKLPAIINKSRIYNTYIAIVEIVAILFWILVPGLTNQRKHVTYFVLNSILSIGGVMYVHVNYRIKYFQKSIIVAIIGLTWIGMLMYTTFAMFVST